MDLKVKTRDFNNRGGYKTKVTDGKVTIIDSNSVNRMESHINTITDNLFLGLSRGMRFPALFTGEAYYDADDDDWKMRNSLNQGKQFYTSVAVDKFLTNIQHITVSLNLVALAQTDATPLFFVYNTSTVGDYDNDYVIFPRVESLIGNELKIALDANHAGTWGYYQSANNGEAGLSIGIDCLMQSTGEAADTNFYTPGIPDWTYSETVSSTSSLFVQGYVYNTIIETSDVIDWPCKVKGRAIRWSGDCTTGDVFPGASYIYSTEPVYTYPLHPARFENLPPAAVYKVWIQIDSEVGPDNLDWQLVGCYATDGHGGDIGIGS